MTALDAQNELEDHMNQNIERMTEDLGLEDDRQSNSLIHRHTLSGTFRDKSNLLELEDL